MQREKADKKVAKKDEGRRYVSLTIPAKKRPPRNGLGEHKTCHDQGGGGGILNGENLGRLRTLSC